MNYTQPKISNGILPFLAAKVADNNGLTPERFAEVMGYNVAVRHKIATIKQESGKEWRTVKSWIRQWQRETSDE